MSNKNKSRMLSDSDKLDNLYGELFQEKVPGSSSTKTYVHPAYVIEGLKMATMEAIRDALLEPEWREHALLLLNQRKSERPNIAEFLFEKPGVVATLFQELIVTYFSFSSELLTLKQSSRACNALALLQCMATQPAIRKSLLRASLPNYIYPFLGTTSKENPFNYLRLTGLGVLGTLVKYDDEETVHYLLATGIFPQCLHCMDVGNELTKTVATFIIERILAHKEGLKYCCTIAERFYSVCKLLGNLVEALAEQPYPRLLKHVINCYYQMSESPRACDGLIRVLPVKLADNTFHNTLRNDPATMLALQKLLNNVSLRQGFGVVYPLAMSVPVSYQET